MSVTTKINIFLVLALVYATCPANSRSTRKRSLPSAVQYYTYTFTEDAVGNTQVEHQETSCQRILSSGIHCPYHRNYQGEANNDFFRMPLSRRSTSPWVLIVQEDPTRVPATLMWACCACSSCASRQANGTFTQDHNRYSYPILMKRQVKDLVKNQHLEKEIPVGCTCGEPKQS